jgi:sugar phosphate isomerase/epimerase
MHNRRHFLKQSLALTSVAMASGGASQVAHAIEPFHRSALPRLKISCAAYSYRQFLTGKNPTMTLEDFIAQCAAMDLDGVELTSYYFPQPVTSEYLLRLKKQRFLQGLDVSGTSVGNRFTLPPGESRSKEIALVKSWVDHAAVLGAPCIRIFAGNKPHDATEEQARQWTIECIEECCAHAGQRGVILALENHGGIVSTSDQLLAIVKAVKSDWFGVNLDTGNFRTPDPYADLAKVAPYAVTVQVKTEIAPAGGKKVEADLKRIVEILRLVNYRGYVVLEYEAAENPMTAVPKAVEALKRSVRA